MVVDDDIVGGGTDVGACVTGVGRADGGVLKGARVVGAVVVLVVGVGIMVGMSGAPSVGSVGSIVNMGVGPMVSLLHT